MNTKSTGSLKNWSDQDFIDEMLIEREAMSDKKTKPEEISAIVKTAGIMTLCCSGNVRLMVNAHYFEMVLRMNLRSRTTSKNEITKTPVNEKYEIVNNGAEITDIFTADEFLNNGTARMLGP